MHNHNVIKQFIEQFKKCPKCGHLLKVNAVHNKDVDDTRKFIISTNKDRITINIVSKYFITTKDSDFEFSISIVNGQIIYSDTTNKFVSLYDLDIILYKDCDNCTKSLPPETFHQSINIFYDRSYSSFVAEPWIDFFSFVYSDSYYYYCNDFNNKKSFLSFQTLNHPARNPIIETPFIPLEKFEFRNREKLFSKINSIRLLI